MKFTIDTTEKTIELVANNPIEMTELLRNLETLKELYDGYEVSLVNPSVLDLFPTQPVTQPYLQPWNPSPWTTKPNQPYGQQITYTNDTRLNYEKNQ